MARTYRFTNPATGETVTRRSDADYTHASVKDGTVRFHGSAEAAGRRGGSVHSLADLQSVTTSGREPADEGATCTIGPRATDGSRCGAPAVTSFTGRDSKRYHECEGHACG